MVQLTFLEEVKDKASRLIPTAYMEIVEEATAPHLSVPIYEHVMFLCDSANSKPTAVGDIVRALRRRITDDNAAVKHLLVLLLEAMMKNCGTNFHVEVCSQKGLLRDLVNLASDPPSSARGMQAKEAALTLVLNVSIWFAGHPDPACHLLTTLAGDVRVICGPNAFEGIRPDTNTRIRMTSAPGPKSQHPQAGASKAGAKAPKAGKDKRNYVDAIAIDLPNEAMLAGMLDSCVAFSEYLNNAIVTPEGDIVFDDVVSGFASKVEKDHDYVTILLSSNLQVDRDVLRSISDSQSSVLARLRTKQPTAGQGSTATEQVHVPQTSTFSSASAPVPVMDSATTATTAPTGATPPRAVVPPAPAASTDAQPPNMDEIFASAPPQAAPVQPAPAPSVDDIFGAPQEVAGAPPANAAPAEAAPAPAPEPTEAVPATVPTDAPAEHPQPEDTAPPAAAAPAPAPAAADDDDFDAFLEGKLKK